MNVSINQLVKSLLRKDSLDQCSLPELTAYAESNPYFGAAQLLLAKKMQTEAPADFEEQYQKTLLYFHNPLWVQQLLYDTGSALVSMPEKTANPETVSVPAPEIEKEPVHNSDNEINEETVSREETIPETGTPDTGIIAPIPAALSTTEEPVTADSAVIVAEETQYMALQSEIPAPRPVEGPAADLLFEPYHTVDYFASQGIRIRDEEKPTDQLGKQLKSFTDWLKTMRRLQPAEIGQAVSQVAEQKVAHMAGESITEREVLTEAMAEVWEKQGNTLKATEIYRKLSLLEPAKSPYFAAKIDALKKKL